MGGGGRRGTRGTGAGRGPGNSGLGAGGRCVCPKCGGTHPHQPGVPCMEARCPDCGVALLREGSPHHQEVLRRRSTATKNDDD